MVPTCEQRLRTSTSCAVLQRRAEIDLHAGEDERLETAENADAGLLEIRRIDGVVDVAHGVDVAKADTLALDPGVRRHRGDGIDGGMPGETRTAVFAQPQWLRDVPTDRKLPGGASVVHTGCGTSFHAAQTGGRAVQALEAVLDPPEADVLVCVSHEGDTALTLEAARAFRGDVWLVTGKPSSPLADLAAEVIVATPQVERSWCHTAELHLCGGGTRRAARPRHRVAARPRSRRRSPSRRSPACRGAC